MCGGGHAAIAALMGSDHHQSGGHTDLFDSRTVRCLEDSITFGNINEEILETFDEHAQVEFVADEFNSSLRHHVTFSSKIKDSVAEPEWRASRICDWSFRIG